MSYDLRIAVKVAGAEHLYALIAEPEWSSPTYNLGKMLRACTSWDFEQRKFYNIEEVYPKINRGIYELMFNPEAYIKYNSPNGWNGIVSALKVLKSLKKCIDDITEPNSCADWNTIPRKYLYVAW